ncbi:MAG: hypothetical protein AAFX50_06045 [Acidobacteriota bacterium]
MSELRLEAALRILTRHGVEFVVVVGVAGVLHGSPFTTQDLDVVYHQTPANAARLARATAELEARYLDLAGRHIEPDAPKLASLRVHLLETNCGRLDLSTSIPPDLSYGDLVAGAETQSLGGVRIHIVSLRTLIESKGLMGRPKDHYQLHYLRQLEAELRSDSGGDD